MNSTSQTAPGGLFLPVRWLISPRVDLPFLIGSVLVSYGLLVAWLQGWLSALDLLLLWIFVFHGPHFFATMSRTFLDPTEWRERGPVLRRSLLWFLLGPLAVGAGWLAASAFGSGTEASGNDVVLSFFFFAAAWAYHHVVKQHFGFMALYRAKHGEFDARELQWHRRYIVWSLWLPVAGMLLSTPFWLEMVPGLRSVVAPWAGPVELFRYTTGVGTACFALFWVVQVAFVASLVVRRRRGRPLNLPELLIVLTAVPLHYVVAISVLGKGGLDAYVLVPLVTIFHNVQYHALVWCYNRTKYAGEDALEKYGAAARLAAQPWLYVAAGVAYTLVTIGPEYLGVYDVAQLEPGGYAGRALAGLIWGWSFLHYYLDGHIWRVRHDPELRRVFGFPEPKAPASSEAVADGAVAAAPR